MTDYQNAIDRLDSIAPTLATTSLDQNPDEGARALALSRATGVPALTVYDDLPEFESDHRAKLTTSIVRGNDQLAAYLRGNPLADVVSNDDYGNLDNFSRTVPGLDYLDKVFERFVTDPLIAGTLGAAQGVYEGEIGRAHV